MKNRFAKWLSLATSKFKYLETTGIYTNYDLTKILRYRDEPHLFSTDGYRAHALYGLSNLEYLFYNRAGKKSSRVEGALYPNSRDVFKSKKLVLLDKRLIDFTVKVSKYESFYEVLPNMLVNADQLDEACSLEEEYELLVEKDSPPLNALHILYRTPFHGVEGTRLRDHGMVYARAAVMPQRPDYC